MTTFIQMTDTNNDILRFLPLGDISKSIVTTYSFRIWNDLSQVGGIQTLDKLSLDLMYPPLQGITTLAKNDVIKIRCTYSGERSKIVSTSFQSFPIIDSEYDRLEPFTYNEYEVQIDFSDLTQRQKDDIDLIDMRFNITAKYVNQYTPLSVPKSYDISSDTSITVLGRDVMATLSDVLIIWEGIHVVSDTLIV